MGVFFRRNDKPETHTLEPGFNHRYTLYVRCRTEARGAGCTAGARGTAPDARRLLYAGVQTRAGPGAIIRRETGEQDGIGPRIQRKSAHACQ